MRHQNRNLCQLKSEAGRDSDNTKRMKEDDREEDSGRGEDRQESQGKNVKQKTFGDIPGLSCIHILLGHEDGFELKMDDMFRVGILRVNISCGQRMT